MFDIDDSAHLNPPYLARAQRLAATERLGMDS